MHLLICIRLWDVIFECALLCMLKLLVVWIVFTYCINCTTGRAEKIYFYHFQKDSITVVNFKGTLR